MNQGNQLHPDLKKVYFEVPLDPEREAFKKNQRKNTFIKWCVNIFLMALGLKHYDAQSVVGYTSYLLSRSTVKKIIPSWHIESMLDIGAWDGSITEKFKTLATNIYFLETSTFFQKKLQKRGYKKFTEASTEKMDLITILNVLDVCKNPEEVMEIAKKSIKKNGKIVISLPFPIRLSIHDKSIKPTNNLWKLDNSNFESSVNDFYEKRLKSWWLTVTSFSEIPYIVHLWDRKAPYQYRNGIFVCTCEKVEDRN